MRFKIQIHPYLLILETSLYEVLLIASWGGKRGIEGKGIF